MKRTNRADKADGNAPRYSCSSTLRPLRFARRYELKRVQWLEALLQTAADEGHDAAVAALNSVERDEANRGGGPSEVVAYRDIHLELNRTNIEKWANEWHELRTRHNVKEADAAVSESHEMKKHEHYARLLKLPRLIDETLSTWIDPADDLSDKQIFQVRT